MAKFFVGFIDRLDKVREAGRLVDRPEPGKTIPKQLDLALGQQADSNNPILGQSGAPNPNLHQVKRLKCKADPTVTLVSRSKAFAAPRWDYLGRRPPQESGNAASAAPKFRVKLAFALFSHFQCRRIILRVNFNRIAEVISADQVQSIIHLGPPGPEKSDRAQRRHERHAGVIYFLPSRASDETRRSGRRPFPRTSCKQKR